MADERPDARETSVVARHPRLVYAILVLAALALFLWVSTYLSAAFFAFGDVILVFFLAWLIAFMVTPAANLILRFIPRVNRAIAVVVVYVALVAVVSIVVTYLATVLAGSVTAFLESLPTYQRDLPTILAPLQDRLTAIGLKVDVVSTADAALAWLQSNASGILNLLQSVAFASIGVIGNAIIVFFLSLYIAIDREKLISFLYRIVPPRFGEEASFFQLTIGRSFGGFIRSQLIQGFMFAALALATHLLLGLPFAPFSAAVAGILQAIPFFGPFLSWSPPVLVAVFAKPEAILPAIAIMAAGWFVTMNIVQPRLMAGALSIHPIVVLGSVIVGNKVAGIAGAIFSIPIAAIMSAFFFYLLRRTEQRRTVSDRAAALVSEREGRPVRAPREPAFDEPDSEPPPTAPDGGREASRA